ncbi:MAG TPA: pitrilysin family protein [Candidatus Binatia bacterium]|nr:pitrilysin family protein [Candidatus Binatia bacterium]
MARRLAPRPVQWPALAAALALGLLAAACAGGPAAPAGARGAAPARAVSAELPPPSRETLPNGLKLIVQEHWAADVVAVYMWIAVGVRDEAPDQLGYSHFQEHMLFKGTDRWGPGYIDRAVEGVGGRSNAVTSFDYTTFYMTLPADQLESAVQILADMAFRSTFEPAEIDRERQVIFEEARIEQDNPRTALVRQLYAMVFAGTPYGRPLLGTPPTMKAATRDRLRGYYRLHYTPDNMTMVVVGPVTPADVKGVVQRAFGAQDNSRFKRGAAPPAQPLSGRIARDVERPEQQGMLGMAWLAPKADDASGNAVDLLTTIIAGAESSRLVQSLRDRDRLVQNVKMNYSALAGAGIVTLWAELEAKDLATVEQAVLAEITRIQEQGVTEEERQLAVTRAESQYAFDRETAEGLAFAYGLAELTWSLDEELRYIDTLRGVTREQIQEAARRWLPTANYARIGFAPRKAQ